MALKMTLDLEHCTFAQLKTFVRALEAAGVRDSAVIDGAGQLSVSVADGQAPLPERHDVQKDIGDVALGTLLDALSKRRQA